MKYIRTKYGFYRYIWKDCNIEKNSRDLWEGFFVKNNYIYEKIRHWEYDEKYTTEYRKIDQIVKQADTIEELCDGWVLESKAYTSGFFVIYNTEDNKEKMKNFKLRKGETLFAFIKTDKGLIYVAKMNDKGELELL